MLPGKLQKVTGLWEINAWFSKTWLLWESEESGFLKYMLVYLHKNRIGRFSDVLSLGGRSLGIRLGIMGMGVFIGLTYSVL